MEDFFKYLEEDKAASVEFAHEAEVPWPKVEIDDPDAHVGDIVQFDNPRTKEREHEFGRVVKVITQWQASAMYSHLYFVRPEGKKYVVTVKSLIKVS